MKKKDYFKSICKIETTIYDLPPFRQSDKYQRQIYSNIIAEDSFFCLNKDKSYKCEVTEINIIRVYDNHNKFYYDFFESEFNKYFYNNIELRKIKVEKLNKVHESNLRRI